MSNNDIETDQLKARISFAQKIGIFFFIPVFVVVTGIIIYDQKLADPGVIALTGLVILVIFLVTAYLFVRKLVKKQYDAYLRMQLMAITDDLTQLSTKTHFKSLFQNELAKAIRYERVLCCSIIEIDGFNEIKEKYGRQISDELLQETAESLKDDLRVIDVLAREGDRFLCLLPETGIEPAMFVSKRLRSVIEGDTFDTGGNDGVINITISIGITESNPGTDDVVDLHKIIKIADKALAIAKEKGGNTIEFLNNKSQAT